MKKRVQYVVFTSLFLVAFFFSLGFMIGGPQTEVQNIEPQLATMSERLPPIEGTFDVLLIRDGVVIQESHGPITIDARDMPKSLLKLIYNDGLESIETAFADGVLDGPFTNISVCNGTTGSTGCPNPVAGGTEGFVAYNSCGLGSVTGAVLDNGVGNVTVSNQFTITAGCTDININVSRLTNDTGGLWIGKALDSPITNAQGNDLVNISATWWGVSG